MKKVLFVSYDFPYPTNSGGKNRAYHMLKYSGNEFKKYLYSFIRQDFKSSYIEEMGKIGVEVVGTRVRQKIIDKKNIFGLIKNYSIFKTLYYSNYVSSELMKIIIEKKIDVVHFESFYTAFYISEEIKNTKVKQIFGTENIEYKIYEEYVKNASFLLKPLYSRQVKLVKKEEEKMFKTADICVAVSEAEKNYIEKFGVECEIVRNGVDLEKLKYNPVRKHAKNILFVGNFSYLPNVDAINFFYNEVFSLIGIEDVRLTIVGKKVSDLKINFDSRVELINFIPEIEDAYKSADIVVSPVKLGGGTNFKILEALACGVPVVALPDRLEGLDIDDGKNIMIAKNAEDFKVCIERLINDEVLREKISKNGRKLVEQEYSWKVIGNNLATVWKNV